MTQLSIAKAGIIEVFLYNLRESIRSMMLYRDDPRLALTGLPTAPLPGTIRSLYHVNDPRWYKYNMLPQTDPLYKYSDMDLYFYRKQLLQDQARLQLSKSGSLKNRIKKNPNSKSPAFGYSQSNALPPLITDRAGNVSKIELEEKTQEILVRDEEIETLKAKLKRLEHLLGLKDARIQDLTNQVDKFKPGTKRLTNTNNNNTNKSHTPVKNEN